MQIGDDEAEEQDQAIRRVNTVMAMSSMAPNESLQNSKLRGLGGSLHSTGTGAVTDVGIMMNQTATMAPAPTVKPPFWRRCIALLDVSLLRDGNFLVLLLGLSLFYVAEMNFKMIIPFFFASLGFGKMDVAFCLSMAAISDIAARVVLPPICDRLRIRKKLVFFVSIIFVFITRSSECLLIEEPPNCSNHTFLICSSR